MTKLLISFTLIILISSCSNQSRLKDRHLIAGRCEQEFNKTKLSSGQAIWQQISETSGTGASYLVTGLAYSTDFIVSFSGGVIGGIAVCSPLLAIDVMIAGVSRDNNHASFSGSCLGEAGTTIGKEINPKLGPRADKHTKKWQCPSLDHIAEGLMNVADCYAKSGEVELAKQQLDMMSSSDVFQKCLPNNMKNKISDKNKNLRL